MISVCMAVHNRADMIRRNMGALLAAIAMAGEPCEVVIATDDPQAADAWPPKCQPTVVRVSLPFSAGAWRCAAASMALGEVMVMLDCDMRVPPGYLRDVAALVRQGLAAFPLYQREMRAGGPLAPGNGYGNAAWSRDVWRRLAAVAPGGNPWGNSTVWGKEDVAAVRLIRDRGIAPIWRQPMPGLIHVWHPKPAGDWYGGVGAVRVGDEG
jgi:hypothetical protein